MFKFVTDIIENYKAKKRLIAGGYGHLVNKKEYNKWLDTIE